jgi:hypothetical protein
VCTLGEASRIIVTLGRVSVADGNAGQCYAAIFFHFRLNVALSFSPCFARVYYINRISPLSVSVYAAQKPLRFYKPNTLDS